MAQVVRWDVALEPCHSLAGSILSCCRVQVSRRASLLSSVWGRVSWKDTDKRCALPCSDLNLPWGGLFTIYSPAEAHNRTLCSHSCMHVHAKDMAGRKLTSLVMQGETIL